MATGWVAGPAGPRSEPRSTRSGCASRLTFADGGSLRLFDQRRLGRVRLDPAVEALGPDAQQIGRKEFVQRVSRSRAPVKARLLDQSVVAGVGNLLADETLWQAKISPQRPADELAPAELNRLLRACTGPRSRRSRTAAYTPAR